MCVAAQEMSKDWGLSACTFSNIPNIKRFDGAKTLDGRWLVVMKWVKGLMVTQCVSTYGPSEAPAVDATYTVVVLPGELQPSCPSS